MSMQGVVD